MPFPAYHIYPSNAVVYMRNRSRFLCIKEICCHQQLQAQLRRDVHIGYILSIPVLVVVVEVFSYLLENNAIDLFKEASSIGGLFEAAFGIQHLLDGATDASRLSQDHKLETITGDKGHVLAQAMVSG